MNWISKLYVVCALCVSMLYLEVFLKILGIITSRKIKLGVGALILRNGKTFPSGTVHIKGNHFLLCWQARMWCSFYIQYLLVWISLIFLHLDLGLDNFASDSVDLHNGGSIKMKGRKFRLTVISLNCQENHFCNNMLFSIF